MRFRPSHFRAPDPIADVHGDVPRRGDIVALFQLVIRPPLNSIEQEPPNARTRRQARGPCSQERRCRSSVHALRRPHHAAVRRLPRRRDPHHRRASRAGGRPRCRFLGALQSRKHRRGGDHGRARRDRRRHRHRERLAGEFADPDLRRPGPVQPAPQGIAAGDGPPRRGSADHQVLRRRLPDGSHPRVRRARDPPRGFGHSRSRLSRDPDGHLERSVRVGERDDPADPHRVAAAVARPRRGPQRDRDPAERAAPDADGGHERQVVARRRGDESLHRRDPHARRTRTAWVAVRCRTTRPSS